MPHAAAPAPDAPVPAEAPARLGRRDALGLALVTLLAAVLRVAGLGDEPLWLDEATTAAFSARSTVGAITPEVQHPPLHNLLTHAALEAFAPDAAPARLAGVPEEVVRAAAASNALVRLPAALAGVLLVPALAFLARRLARREHARAAFHAAAVLAATSPFLVVLSQEARNFSLYALLSVASTLAYLRLRDGSGRRPGALAAYAALSLLLLLTNYLGALVLLAHEVVTWAGWARARRSGVPAPVALRGWLWARLAVALLYLPWVAWVVTRLLAQTDELQARHWIGSPMTRIPYSLLRYALGYGLWPESSAAVRERAGALLLGSDLLAVLLVAPFVALLALGLRRQALPPARRALVLLTLLLPYALLVPLSPWMKLVHERYLVFQAPLLLALLALGWAGARSRARLLAALSLAPSVALGLLASGPVAVRFTPLSTPYAKEAWDQAAAYVARERPDVVLLAPGYLTLAFDRAWIQGAAAAPGGPTPARAWWPRSGRPPDAQSSDEVPALSPGQRLAVVTSHLGADGEADLLRRLEAHDLVAEREFPEQSGIRVRLYEAGRGPR